MLADTQQQRLLERLREAGEQPVAFAELHADGVDFPAAVVCELDLGGYAVERVYDHGRLVGVRLLEPESRTTRVAPAIGLIANVSDARKAPGAETG